MGGKKHTTKRGQTMNLSAFNGPQDESHTNNDRFADDVYIPPPSRTNKCTTVGLPQRRQHQDSPNDQEPCARPTGRCLFEAGVNKKLGDFRNEAAVSLNTVVPDDLDAPFVAFVGNLQHGISDCDVRDAFSPELPCMAIVVRNKSTFAFVEFISKDALQRAVLMSGKIVCGRPMKVSLATKQQAERMLTEKEKVEQLDTEQQPATCPLTEAALRKASGMDARLKSNVCSSAATSTLVAELSRNVFGSVAQPSTVNSTTNSSRHSQPHSSPEDAHSDLCSSAASPCGATSTTPSSVTPPTKLRRSMKTPLCGENWRSEPRQVQPPSKSRPIRSAPRPSKKSSD